MKTQLSTEIAATLAGRVLDSVHREYPSKIGHVLLSDADARPPRELTPVFYGSFDWHSAVHSHWTLVRLLRLLPGAPWAEKGRHALEKSFAADKVRAEVAYLSIPERRGFEMPYGMGWLLMLCAELRASADDPRATRWLETLAPLEELAAERFETWLGRLAYPIRTGEHTNTAFGLALFLDWADAAGRPELAALARQRALALYGADRGGPLAYEPSAHDFLSPCLAEADLLCRVLEAEELATWLSEFLPEIDLAPVTPLDRADGKLVHFDGLNLSRAWMLRQIAGALPPDDPRQDPLGHLADAHQQAGFDGLTSEHYAGAHWLATFALYVLAPPRRGRLT